MAIPTKTKAWILQKKPVAAVNFSSGSDATFVLKTLDISSSIPEDSLLVQALWFSNDPAQRGLIQKGADPDRLYVRVDEGDTMWCLSIAKVLKVGGKSDSDIFDEGDLVATSTGWSEYAVVKKAGSELITTVPNLSPTVFLGALGGPGLTAYWGLIDVLKLQRGEILVISGAAGAVGNVVVQLAKNMIGTKTVIAIAGSKEKTDYLKSIGADVVLNYKSPDFEKELIDATPGYVDAFFDNVGGELLDLMLTRMKQHGRIAACGAISTYNDHSKASLRNYFQIISNRLILKGFIVIDYFHRPEGRHALIEAIRDEKLMIKGGETLVEVSGIEEVPKVWHRLFEGRNQGKLVTELPA